jgi:DNA-binding response OmpR family regulator
VLIIDDNATLLRAYERALSRHFEVECTISPTKALELLHLRSYDAILCDVMLPNEISGPEFATRVCDQWPELRHKIIFMTGGTFDPEEERRLAKLDHMVLAKPIDFNALIAVLSSC